MVVFGTVPFRGATSTLDALGRHNVRVVQAKPLEGWPECAPYQDITVLGASSVLPLPLLDQLDLGGRLVIPLGNSEAQLIERLRKRVDGLDSQIIGAAGLDMLPNGERRPTVFPWVSGRHGK